MLLPASDPEPPSPDAAAAVAVRAAIGDGLRRLLAAAAELRPGEPGGVETVHQMRVAARRLRSDLRTFGPMLDPDWEGAIRGELKWLGGTLGTLRERDVLIHRLERDAGENAGALAPLFEALEREREDARRGVTEALAGDRYAGLVGRLTEAAREPKLAPGADAPCRKALPPLAAAAWKKLAKAARRLEPDSPDEAYHEARIRAKRVRYASEAVGPALKDRDRRAARKFARLAAALQDVLGEHQDAAEAGARVTDLLELSDDRAYLDAADRLIGAQYDAKLAARRAFPGVWDELDRKERRRWLK